MAVIPPSGHVAHAWWKSAWSVDILLIERRKCDVQSQHHAQHELIPGYRSASAFHRERLLDQLLKLERLQHRRHR
jgi:hypothetical protein